MNNNHKCKICQKDLKTKCNCKESKWVEEFEDSFDYIYDEMGNEHGLNFFRKDMDKLLEKYFGKEYLERRIKIKCKDGLIQIKRIG